MRLQNQSGQLSSECRKHVGTAESVGSLSLRPPRARTTLASIMADAMTTIDAGRRRDLGGLACLYAQLIASWWIVPDWSLLHVGEPVFLAAIGGLATSVSIALLR